MGRPALALLHAVTVRHVLRVCQGCLCMAAVATAAMHTLPCPPAPVLGPILPLPVTAPAPAALAFCCPVCPAVITTTFPVTVCCHCRLRCLAPVLVVRLVVLLLRLLLLLARAACTVLRA